ncbi:MAG: hypothetical protein R3Y24_02790 [Eubacteriales bacterium]
MKTKKYKRLDILKKTYCTSVHSNAYFTFCLFFPISLLIMIGSILRGVETAGGLFGIIVCLGLLFLIFGHKYLRMSYLYLLDLILMKTIILEGSYEPLGHILRPSAYSSYSAIINKINLIESYRIFNNRKGTEIYLARNVFDLRTEKLYYKCVDFEGNFEGQMSVVILRFSKTVIDINYVTIEKVKKNRRKYKRKC